MGSGGVLIFSSVQLIIAKFSASLRTNSLVQHCSYYGKYFKNTNSLRVHKYRSHKHKQSGHRPAFDTHPCSPINLRPKTTFNIVVVKSSPALINELFLKLISVINLFFSGILTRNSKFLIFSASSHQGAA